MSNAKQHAEWLSLVEVSGPFLTLSVLNQSFQFGLDAHESDVYRSVKEAYQEWEESNAPYIHTAWIRFLLMTVLGYPAEFIGEAQSIPESAVANLEIQGERIRPDLAILDPDDPRKVKLPILTYSRSQKLDAPVAGSSWSAAPHSRMQLLLQNTGLQAGFVTNGAQWSLVHVRKGEPTGFATWQTILLTEEKLLLQAFKGVLGVEATLGAPEGKSLFDLLDKSAQDQEEVTKELGRQVRQAVEVFINAVDRLDQDSGRKLLTGLEPKEVYNGALTVMMRLIFLLCAEERGLMDDRELYVQNYSVGALNDQLREIASGDEQVLEHRHDAWKRLLATFRLVHGGCNHENLNLPAYGGSLFDPAKYPYLEQCQIDNRVSLHLLDALEFLEIKVPGGGRETRRLSFRALGVEQIGHVYEGLLDHTAVRAEEAVVGLTGKETEEDEIALSALEANKSQIAKFFEREKIKVSGNPEKLLQQGPNVLKVSKLRVARGTDDKLYERALPFLNIIREDSLEHLQVYPEGSIYVTAGADRRTSGTHYTPISLTEEVVQYALEPQVYVGPAEGLPRTEWKLKTAKEIVDLKVCDLAMGSGAFLVQACRYLSERLVEAWGIAAEKAQRPIGFSTEGHFFTKRIEGDHYAKTPGSVIETPFGTLTVGNVGAELISDQPEERLAQARRVVADRCLYGVDINPMAVEMAKLSLWLTTMRRDKPFTFLDHALRVGDSLLGVSELQFRAMTMRPSEDTGALMFHWVPQRLEEVRELRKQLSRIPSHDLDSVRRKAQITFQAELKSRWLQEAADILMLAELRRLAKEPMAENEWNRLMAILKEGLYKLPDELADLKAAQKSLNRTTFNWELEYPEIFECGGFDAVLGNPPFLGGKKISGYVGVNYREFLVEHVAGGTKGNADLCSYFLLRGQSLLRPNGTLGIIATNTISEGDTRDVGLMQIVSAGNHIYRAEKSSKWPSTANLEIAKVWTVNGLWKKDCTLDGKLVSTISPFLNDDISGGIPYKLKRNSGFSYQGSVVLGTGFILEETEARHLLSNEQANGLVVLPFVNGDDINSRFDQSPSRWVINFLDWPLGRVGQRLPNSNELVQDVIARGDPVRFSENPCSETSHWNSEDGEASESLGKRRVKWLQLGVVPKDYPYRVAADFPECLRLVELRVWPQRATVNRDKYRNKWWQFAEPCLNLYRSINGLDRCIVVATQATKYVALSIYPTNVVFSNAVAVITSDNLGLLASVNSSIHDVWTRAYASSLETRIRYAIDDCFQTFPFPDFDPELVALGHELTMTRKTIQDETRLGLTDVLNNLHNRDFADQDIQKLRNLQVAIDNFVCRAFGWNIALEHGFYQEGSDYRFTVAPSARLEILRRLLQLNHYRYGQELENGLDDKGRGKVDKTTRKSSAPTPQSLFGD